MIAGPMPMMASFAARRAVMPAPVNAALLMVSFAIGHGSIFAAQAIGCLSVVASAAVLSMLSGLVVAAPMALLFGLAGLAMAEVFTHAAAASLIYVRLSRAPAGPVGTGAGP